MKEHFKGYYRPSEQEFNKLWSEGLFILDTNVLLNFYSYPEELRNVYFSVLSKLDRRWIPYQVALEFHRNKFQRIKQENKKVTDLLLKISETETKISEEVKSIELEKRNIGVSSIDSLLVDVRTSHTKLREVVSKACEKLPLISLDDPIGEKIAELFNNKVGMPPADQTELDQMLSNAEDRYDKKIPPGFSDIKKGESSSVDRGIKYLDKYGDLILWLQVLNHAKEQKISSIVFVTGDSKRDWWWEEDGKTIGPSPSLAQEISAFGVSSFWMYDPAQFLQYAQKYLAATEVTDDAVQQVKELSEQVSESNSSDNTQTISELFDALDLFQYNYKKYKEEKIDPFYKERNERFFNSYSSSYYGNQSKRPAVEVDQDTEIISTDVYNRGILRVNVLRETIIATGSGKLNPAMISIPVVRAALVKMPEACNSDTFKFSAGTGTTFDFNINIRSRNPRLPLPLGEYVFTYEAVCSD